MQYKPITGATYNNTIYLTYITKQYDYLFKLTIEFIHYLQKLYKYIGYLHSYCHNEQQNKDNLITYQKKIRYQFLHYDYIYYTITYATYDEQKKK